jgi:hypothetical protein
VTGQPRRFNPPPNWPSPPPGWQPNPGWKPDPSWPPPPLGWQPWVTREVPNRPSWWATLPTWQKVTLIVMGMVGILVVLGALQSGGEEGLRRGDDDNSAYVKVACREWVKERLKAPSTADFVNEMVSKVGKHYTVNGAVDAENSFGAQIRTPFVCIATHDGEASTLVGLHLE